MEWFQKFTQEYLPLISDNKIIQASLIFLLAVIVSLIAKAILHRLQVHGAGRTNNPIDDQLFGTLKKPLSLSIILVGIHLAVARSQLLEPSEKSKEAGQTGLELLDSILITIAILFWLGALVSFAKFVLKYLSGDDAKLKMVQKHTLPLFENLAVIILYGAGVYFVIAAWGGNLSGWIASAGILGLALSFAAKDTLANLFAGVFILADSPYKIGDFIVLDSGERGMVTHIGIRSTRILTRSDVEITIPNAIMGNTKITNETAGPHSKYRLRIQVGVAYGSDISVIRKALLDATENVQGVEKHPEARVRFRTFGDSSLNFELLCWVAEPVLRGSVSDIINEKIYNLFNERGIVIPFPQTDVHIHQTKE